MSMTIQPLRLGFAVGTTMAALYLGCALVMSIAGQEATITFFNTLLHGIDTRSIIRMDMPRFQFLCGLIQTFILGWLIGASIASLYNFSLQKGLK